MFLFIEAFWWLLMFGGIVTAVGIHSHESEQSWSFLLSFIISFLVLQFMFGIDLWGAVVSNPLTIFGLVLVYFFCGAVWVLLWKWPRYCERIVSKVRGAAIHSYHLNDTDTKTEDQARKKIAEDQLSIDENLERITAWIVAWPFGLFWSLLRDPITWLAKTWASMIGSSLKRIAERAVSKL